MKRKGFTFIELIIVIAIFGILLAVITPAWMSYLHRSKFRTQNQKSKAVFNAAQVVLTDLEFTERKYRALLSDPNQRDNMPNYIYTPINNVDGATSEEWFFYWDGVNGYQCQADGSPIDTSDFSDRRLELFNEWNERIANSIYRIASDEMVYKIWVRDYQVQSVACAESERSRFIGAHPTTVYEIQARDVDTDDLEHTTVEDVDLRWFDLVLGNDPAEEDDE